MGMETKRPDSRVVLTQDLQKQSLGDALAEKSRGEASDDIQG
jgi:hypothetical protein